MKQRNFQKTVVPNKNAAMNNVLSQHTNSTSSFIRILSLIIGIIILCTSRYAFIFYSAAMIPSVVSIFVDNHENKCSSATVSTFNLIGVLPYIINLWHNGGETSAVQDTVSNIKIWVMIYGTSLVGYMLYWAIPHFVSRLYTIKSSVQSTLIASERDRICSDWGIKSDDPFRGILDEKGKAELNKKIIG